MAIQIILPGQCFVTNDPAAVIETCLGSCVGVALYDSATGIGGMIHVLLPSASEEREKSEPSRFARSAVPLLLSEMEALGAVRSSITASIAGGALILADRPLSIELNIGKRNHEMVRRLLQDRGIPILRQDVGGHSGRVFRLDLTTGVSSVRRIDEKRRAFSHEASEPRRLSADELGLRIVKLKPLPEVARKIIFRMDHSDPNLSDLEHDILQDQAVVANVLKASNSAWYGYQNRITTVKRALTVIGLSALKKLVLCSSVHDLYDRSLSGYSAGRGDLMKHSVCCGLLAELIAREKGIDEPELVFTAGLLHDVGKVILDQYAFEEFNRIMDKVLNEGMTFLEAEEAILGFNHAQVGGVVTREWNLPDVLTEAIFLHHCPEDCRVNPKLVSAVHLADQIASMFGEGCGTDELSNRIHQFAVSTLGLRKDDVERIVERLPDVVRQVQMM